MRFTIAKKLDKDVSAVENDVLNYCKKYGLEKDDKNPEIVFVLGGDGTFLKAVHAFLDRVESIKFVGIRCGTLGFFYNFNPEDVEEAVKMIANNAYKEDKHKLIECKIGKKILYAVNEIRFENPFHTLVCNVKINNREFETFHGTGLLVCGALGSTAYNKSLGGAVIAHDLDVLQLTEVSTIQNNIYRSLGSPYIVSHDAIFTFEGNFSKVIVGYDHLSTDCGEERLIQVSYSNKEITILYDEKHSYIGTVKRSFIK